MIKHILSDGRVLDDITGITVPRNGHTETAYRVLAEILEGGKSHGTAQRGVQQNLKEA